MEGIKNYTLQLINKNPIGITKEQADQVLLALNHEHKYIKINNSVYATHQIVAIEKCDDKEERDLLEQKGLIPK